MPEHPWADSDVNRVHPGVLREFPNVRDEVLKACAGHSQVDETVAAGRGWREIAKCELHLVTGTRDVTLRVRAT